MEENLSSVQLGLIEKFLKDEVINISRWVKNNPKSRYYLWNSVYKLEKLGLIERVSKPEEKTSIRYKRNFTKEDIEKKFGIIALPKIN